MVVSPEGSGEGSRCPVFKNQGPGEDASRTLVQGCPAGLQGTGKSYAGSLKPLDSKVAATSCMPSFSRVERRGRPVSASQPMYV